MLYTNKKGEVYPSRTYGGKNWYGGFSDHLPIFFIPFKFISLGYSQRASYSLKPRGSIFGESSMLIYVHFFYFFIDKYLYCSINVLLISNLYGILRRSTYNM